MVIVIVKHLLTKIIVSVALVRSIVGCGARPVEPATNAQPPAPPAQSAAYPAQTPAAQTPAAQTPAPPVPTPVAQETARVDPVSTTPTSPPRVPLPNGPRDVARWRSALENYFPAVKPGNHSPVVAPVPFLQQMHARIHPIFKDQFLVSLDQLPTSHPLNRADLSVKLEIILEATEGRIHRMGVVGPSGVTLFELIALESVDRAKPFGPPPGEIVSPDGLVYIHWEFHRGDHACGPWNARPFLLTAP